MSFIGTLEQVSLALILQGIEAHAKTGLLVIKQEEQWVELYFRDGRLMCIGPVRANATLGERLLQAGVISQSALQDALQPIGEAQFGETRVALTLMELGYVSHEGLRAWATKEATNVLKVLFTWQNGTLYFEDGQQPPVDRLLVALSCMSLLPPVPTVMTPQEPPRVQVELAAPVVQTPQPSLAPATPITPIMPITPVVPTQSTRATTPALNAAQIFTDEPISTAVVASVTPDSPMPSLNIFCDSDTPNVSTLTPPQRITTPMTPPPINSSYLRADMVLMPVDLSSLREQNPQLPITPERWRLLTRIDGQTTLQQVCQELAMPANIICQVAAELIALGLVQPTSGQPAAIAELSPTSRELLMASLGNGHIAPGYAASAVPPWTVVGPTTDALPPSFQAALPIETKSQWGNGGNGATFVPGRGWIPASQPLQPLQPSGPLYLNGH